MQTRSTRSGSTVSSSSGMQFIGRRTGKVISIKSYDELFSDSETDASLDITKTPIVGESTVHSFSAAVRPANKKVLPAGAKDGSFSRPVSATQKATVQNKMIGRRTGKDLLAGKKKLPENGRIENYSDLFSDTDESMSLHPTPEKTMSSGSASLASCEESDASVKRSVRRRKSLNKSLLPVRQSKKSLNKSLPPVMSMETQGTDDSEREDGLKHEKGDDHGITDLNRSASLMKSRSKRNCSVSNSTMNKSNLSIRAGAEISSQKSSLESRKSVETLNTSKESPPLISSTRIETRQNSNSNNTSVLSSNKVRTKDNKINSTFTLEDEASNTVESSPTSSGRNQSKQNSSPLTSLPASSPLSDIPGQNISEDSAHMNKSLQSHLQETKESDMSKVSSEILKNKSRNTSLSLKSPRKRGTNRDVSKTVVTDVDDCDVGDGSGNQSITKREESRSEYSQSHSKMGDDSVVGKENHEPLSSDDVRPVISGQEDKIETSPIMLATERNDVEEQHHSMSVSEKQGVNKSHREDPKNSAASSSQSNDSKNQSPIQCDDPQDVSWIPSKVLNASNLNKQSSSILNKQSPTDPEMGPSTSQQGLDFGGTAAGSVSKADKVLPPQFFGIKQRLTFNKGLGDSRTSLDAAVTQEMESFEKRKSYPGSFVGHHSKNKNASCVQDAALDSDAGLNTSNDSPDGFKILDPKEKDFVTVTTTGRRQSSTDNGEKRTRTMNGGDEVNRAGSLSSKDSGNSITLTNMKKEKGILKKRKATVRKNVGRKWQDTSVDGVEESGEYKKKVERSQELIKDGEDHNEQSSSPKRLRGEILKSGNGSREQSLRNDEEAFDKRETKARRKVKNVDSGSEIEVQCDTKSNGGVEETANGTFTTKQGGDSVVLEADTLTHNIVLKSKKKKNAVQKKSKRAKGKIKDKKVVSDNDQDGAQVFRSDEAAENQYKEASSSPQINAEEVIEENACTPVIRSRKSRGEKTLRNTNSSDDKREKGRNVLESPSKSTNRAARRKTVSSTNRGAKRQTLSKRRTTGSKEVSTPVRLHPMSMLPRVTPKSGVSFRRKSSFIPSLQASVNSQSPDLQDEVNGAQHTPPSTRSESVNGRKRRTLLNSLVKDIPADVPEPTVDDDHQPATPQVTSKSRKSDTGNLRKRAILKSARSKGLRVLVANPIPSPYPLVASSIPEGQSPTANLTRLDDSTILPSPSSSPIHYGETTRSERRKSNVEEVVLPDLSYKIIRPDKSNSGLRRSKRTRVKRLNDYKGEGIVYKRDSAGFRVVHSIMPSLGEAKNLAKERVNKKRRMQRKLQANKVPAKTRRMSTHVPVKENVTDGSDISIINPETDERVVVELLSHSQNATWKGPDLSTLTSRDSFGMCVLLNQPSFCTGLLHIRPLCEKPRQATLETLVYSVIHGKVCVTVNNSSFVVENNDDFFIPRGSIYKIKNMRRDIAQMKFFNIHDSTSDNQDSPVQI